MSDNTDRLTGLSALRTILNTKMSEETPVREHMIKMIVLFRKLETLGTKIDADFHVDMVLETLPDSFNPFKISYLMKKRAMPMSLPQLMNELHMAEGILKPAMSVQVQSQGSIGKKDGKLRGKCFHCGEKGHRKRNCVGWWLKRTRGSRRSENSMKGTIN